MWPCRLSVPKACSKLLTCKSHTNWMIAKIWKWANQNTGNNVCRCFSTCIFFVHLSFSGKMSVPYHEHELDTIPVAYNPFAVWYIHNFNICLEGFICVSSNRWLWSWLGAQHLLAPCWSAPEGAGSYHSRFYDFWHSHIADRHRFHSINYQTPSHDSKYLQILLFQT